MNFRRTTYRGRADVILDMTPLIDVVFLLLIFFLMTTTFIRREETAVAINLPTGSAEEVVVEDVQALTVYVDSQGGYTLELGEGDSYSVGREALHGELETFFETHPDLPIFLRGDRGVSYGAVMDVWLLAREIGFAQVNAVIREERPPADQSP